VQALPLGELHSARLLTSHRGAICAHSLTSELADSFRLIMCGKSDRGVWHFHGEYPECSRYSYGEGGVNRKKGKYMKKLSLFEHAPGVSYNRDNSLLLNFYSVFIKKRCTYNNTLLFLG